MEMDRGAHLEFGSLVAAAFVERPNRFVVRCYLEEGSQLVEAHLADPGRLKELLLPGARLYLRPADKPERKTRWSVILVVAPDGNTLVSVQSTLVNRLTQQALLCKSIPGLEEWRLQRAEYPLGNSRWDFLLHNGSGEQLLLEVKSCTLVEKGTAMFPDAVTERGRRHLEELIRLKQEHSLRGAVLFVVQRSDALRFRPADHIDPAFGLALRKARDAGIRIFVHRCLVGLADIRWDKAILADLS